MLGLVVLVGGLWVQEWLDHSTNYLFTLLVFGTAWLGGRVLRGWHSRATYAEQHQPTWLGSPSSRSASGSHASSTTWSPTG